MKNLGITTSSLLFYNNHFSFAVFRFRKRGYCYGNRKQNGCLIFEQEKNTLQVSNGVVK